MYVNVSVQLVDQFAMDKWQRQHAVAPAIYTKAL